MNKLFKSSGIAFRIWGLTVLMVAVLISAFILAEEELSPIVVLVTLIVTAVGSLPAMLILILAIPTFFDSSQWFKTFITKIFSLNIFIGIAYGVVLGKTIGSIWDDNNSANPVAVYVFCMAIICSIATALWLRRLHAYYHEATILPEYKTIFTQTNNTMEPTNYPPYPVVEKSNSSKFLIKGIITGALILITMIPVLFIINLVEERQLRHKEVVKEVSSKWASEQTFSGPFLVIPYIDSTIGTNGKANVFSSKMIIVPQSLNATAKVEPEFRPRSIYKVLLYKSANQFQGKFAADFPQGINPQSLDYSKAKICIALSDYKGIEEEVKIKVGNQLVTLSPGLPVNDFGEIGLSAPVSINLADMQAGIPFDISMHVRGSEKLHFLPLAGTATFQIQSPWASPSFDGNVLPGTRAVKDSGFTANWSFNKANLPFSIASKEGSIKVEDLSFGVSFVQPADQYAKTMRSVKYAILFIGLTFALFFIIELLQKNPFHPVQYVLVGIALSVFYTLLLAISEYLPFIQAYLIAALATALLISLYAKSHFPSWKTAGIFFVVLSLLYAFTYVLISLEDTSLLIGSIGLFVILALVMYASRKINWYGEKRNSIPASSMQ